MRYKVIVAPGVFAKMVQQADYIARQSTEEVASRYMGRLFTYFDELDIFPQRGRPRDDVLQGLRVVGFKNSANIAFVVEGNYVYVLGIYFGGEDYDSALVELTLDELDDQVAQASKPYTAGGGHRSGRRRSDGFVAQRWRPPQGAHACDTAESGAGRRLIVVPDARALIRQSKTQSVTRPASVHLFDTPSVDARPDRCTHNRRVLVDQSAQRFDIW
jgi:toxin ParE1/3/4